ncbi:MAG: class I SAM-dependent methyltransferase [Planctomycetes bacterium]|nr:class I SAM-dependent methyltransferase [Planctomycetota bacterium]MCB9905938.1 class I SAM-dependent methyltransferase [Planctomycetota bacterium]
MQPQVFPHPAFPAHALLDSGGGEKLERFGEVILRRPDPQALWRRRRPDADWASADLAFVRESDRGGRWEARAGSPAELRKPSPEWRIEHQGARFWIRPTAFKHVGIFPEQASNWDWIERVRRKLGPGEPRLLNLFGYTGAASVLAAQAGWNVTHVDASKQSLGWLRENLVASELDERAVRVILDDALAFAQREVRRGRTYHAILLDPPHYGRGPKGETWRLEEGLAPLVEAAGALLEPRAALVLSTYAVGYSPLAFANLLGELGAGAVEVGELAIPEEATERRLPAGFCARFLRGLDLDS